MSALTFKKKILRILDMLIVHLDMDCSSVGYVDCSYVFVLHFLAIFSLPIKRILYILICWLFMWFNYFKFVVGTGEDRGSVVDRVCFLRTIIIVPDLRFVLEARSSRTYSFGL